MRRVLMWGLGLGGVLIVLLLAVLLVVSYRLKNNMQNSINTHLQAIQEHIPAFSYQPFDCSGVGQITCTSSRIGFGNVVLENVRVEVGRFTQKQGSIRIISEELSFPNNEIVSLLFGKPAQDVDFSSVLVPKSLDCSIDGVLGKNGQTQDALDALDTNTTCIAKGKNISYKLILNMQAGLSVILQKAPLYFSDAVLSIIEAYREDSEKVLTQMPILFKNAILSLESKELTHAIIAELAKSDALDHQAYQAYRADLTHSLQSIKAFVVYMTLLSGYGKNAQNVESLVDGVLRLVLGENNGIIYTLKHDDKSNDKSFSIKEWLHDPIRSLHKTGVTFSYDELPVVSHQTAP